MMWWHRLRGHRKRMMQSRLLLAPDYWHCECGKLWKA